MGVVIKRRAIVAGGNPGMKAPVTEILAQDIAVGSTVKLMEGGTAIEYLVVNQGIPSNSNLYDASCDGTWLLRKDCHSKRAWNTSNINNYETSAINNWLNGDFFNSFGSVEQAAIKQVKIPYGKGSGSSSISSGASGLSAKIFLLGYAELGITGNNFMRDGATLAYFSGATDSDRVAMLNGATAFWFTRSTYSGNSSRVYSITSSGGLAYGNASDPSGIRPALVIPQTALFDASTLILKGAA